MPMTSATRRRLAATGSAVALAVASLAVAAPPASADEPVDHTLQWRVSQYLDEHVLTQTFSGGATEDATTGIVTFTGGEGRTDTGTGVTTAAYDGSARYAFTNNGVEYYSITFTDPVIAVDDAGEGTVSADVAWTVFPATTGSATDAVLTTFDATDESWDGLTLGATPDWAGVVPVGTYGTDQPVNGESWAQAFVQALPSSMRALFYSSGSNPASDAKKFPAAFVAEVPGPAVTVTDSTVSAEEISFDVAGTGFSAVTNPGDAGVYAGLAPAGGLPDTSDMENNAFVAAQWVMPGQIVDGAFAASLVADLSKVVAGTDYAIYTWQAHTHSNTTQDTETPVEIDWEELGATEVTPQIQAPTTTYREGGEVVVSVPGATGGTVTLEGLGADRSADLVDGEATFEVPTATAAGEHPLAVAYSGDLLHYPATASGWLTVTKAATTLRATWKTKPTRTKAGTLAVKVTSPAGTVPGRVTLALSKVGGKGKDGATKALTKGAAQLKVGKLTAGTWKGSVTYAGGGNFKADSTPVTVKVAKKKRG